MPKTELQPALGARDWHLDAKLPNGNYMNRCVSCGETFIGHKRRVICRECATGDVK